MQQRRFVQAASLVVAFGFLVAVARPARSEDTPPATAAPEAPAATKGIGPGAPPAKAKTKGKAAKAEAPSKGIQVVRKATIASTVNVHANTVSECQLETKLSEMIAQRNPNVTVVDSPTGTHLELKIVDIHAPSGGWFSGPKWMTVEGKLYAGKTLKGDFLARQTSMASATACGMLDKVMVVMAGDIAGWLNNPTKGARLGSAR
jgi:hypothetical protein